MQGIFAQPNFLWIINIYIINFTTYSFIHIIILKRNLVLGGKTVNRQWQMSFRAS